MCTVILGVDVLAPRSVLLAANRDEDPGRPSEPPHALATVPRLTGGSDRRAGGTWLAIRGRRAAAALLNRRPREGAPAPTRSRGLLTMDVAAAGDDAQPSLAPAAEARFREQALAYTFAPFSMLWAEPGASWIGVHEPGRPLRVEPIRPGWHVVTHQDLDDAMEPRTAWLVRDLAAWHPASLDAAIAGLQRRLALHADPDAGIPAVCIHEGRMVTVSASLVWLAPGGARYLHAEGRPCVTGWNDVSHLLEDSGESQ